MAVVALLVGITPLTVVAEETQPHSKRAEKVLRTLNSLGINDPSVKELVTAVDENITPDKRLLLYERKVGDGQLVMDYEFSGGVGIKQAALKYQPEDSNMEYTARTSGVMAAYKLKF